MSKSIQIQESGVIDVLKNGSAAEKTFVAKLFGKNLPSIDITDRVKTVEDAIALVGATDNQRMLLGYNGIDKEMLAAQAFMQLSIVRKALNEDWEPDWSNQTERKYYPWLKYQNAGSGFAFGGFGCGAGLSVGSRLCFKSEDLAEYAAKQFADLYNKIFIL